MLDIQHRLYVSRSDHGEVLIGPTQSVRRQDDVVESENGIARVGRLLLEGSMRISGVSRSGGLNGDGGGVVVGEAWVPSFEQWPERAVEHASSGL